MILETLIKTIPRFSIPEAQELLTTLYGLTGTIERLPSERDQNFLLICADGSRFVLKIANPSESREALTGQHAVLEHLARHDLPVTVPGLCRTKEGSTLVDITDSDGTAYPVSLLTYVPGEPVGRLRPLSSDMLADMGVVLGHLDRALAMFPHRLGTRELDWDVCRAKTVLPRYLPFIGCGERQVLVRSFLERWIAHVEPALSSLRTSVIHNDGNDDNLLANANERTGEAETVSGVIDFGDIVQTATVCEVAICAAYAILDRSDPLYAAACVVHAYHDIFPLTEQELALLFDLMAMRLCLSVSIAAFRAVANPGNYDARASEQSAWAALDRLASLNPRLAHYIFRDACGFPACPKTVAVVKWLETRRDRFASIVLPDLSHSAVSVFDLRPGNPEWAHVPDVHDREAWTRALFDRIQADGAAAGIGRYDEPRRCYTSEAYGASVTPVEEYRTVHLGMDIFQDVGAPVFAPLEGTIWSVGNHDRPLDYGPTIILRHEPEPGTEFFTLYGHLSAESLDRWRPGMAVKTGEQLGTIGDPAVNGGWPPHVHVQLIVDLLDRKDNFPGVCAPRDRGVWLSLCPDPNLLLRIPGLSAAPQDRTPQELIEHRRRMIGKSVSLAYRRPLKLVQGWRQHVYDYWGRAYLDAANNVCQVGHGHPAVVEAARRQLSLLTTNTRYLYDVLMECADRLCATLPEPLRVCYFVCSGSEANELALRLARAYTHGTDVIVVEGGYHGNTSTLVDVSPYKFHGPGGKGAPSWVHVAPLPDCYRGRYRVWQTAGILYGQSIQEIVSQLSVSGRRLMAFLSEPMPSCGGQIIPPPGYLQEAYRIVREAGGVCIADEVQIGLGRMGSHFWGFQTQDVVPDIVTMGKPLGNGYPIGAVVTTRAIADAFDDGMEYFNTFGGNPVACAVGQTVLEVIDREGLQQQALEVGHYLKEQLLAVQARFPMIGEVRGHGLFLGVEFVRDSETKEPAPTEATFVVERLKDYGILLGADGIHRNVLKIKPPLVFSRSDADHLCAALHMILAEPRLVRMSSSA